MAAPLPALAQLQVSPSGALVATFDIVAPPGVAGIQPGIALSYKGSSVESEIGHGWQMSGLSLISRCAGSRAVDGVNPSPLGISFSGRDKLCLDGQRLIPTDASGGQPVVGAATTDATGQAPGAFTEYRTENDRYARIRAYGMVDSSNAQAGPLYFKVWTKDGHILQYGNWSGQDANAVICSTPASGDAYRYAQSWALARSTDRFGNNVDFKYDQGDMPWGSVVKGSSNGHWWHVSEIQYSGNKIVFSYSLLPNASPQQGRETYFYGTKNLMVHSLDTITTYVNSPNTTLGKGTQAVAVRTYHLHKGTSAVTGRMLLKYVQECAGDVGSTKCLPYGTYNYGQADSATPVAPGMVQMQNFTLAHEGIAGMTLFGNFMGTGRTDIITFASTADGNSGYNVRPSKLWANAGNGYFNQILSNADGGKFNLTTEVVAHESLIPVGDEPPGALNLDSCVTYRVADINGDGLPDIVVHSSPSAVIYVSGTAESISCNATEQSVIYFNKGDGSFDKRPLTGVSLAYQQMTTGEVPGKPLSTHIKIFEGHDFIFMDVNNDGIPDLIQTMFPAVDDWWYPANLTDPCASQVCTRLFLGDGTGNFTEKTDTNLAHVSVIMGIKSATDLDGDGLPDLYLAQVPVAGAPTSWTYLGARSRGDGNFDLLTGADCEVTRLGACYHPDLIDYDGSGFPARIYPGYLTPADNRLYAVSSKADMDTKVTNTNLSTDPSMIIMQDPVKTENTVYTIEDFNGDGRQDILVMRQDPTHNKIFLSNGDGTFTAAVGSNITSWSLLGALNGHTRLDGGPHDLLGDGSVQFLVTAYDSKTSVWSNELHVQSQGPAWQADNLAGLTLASGDTYTVTYSTLSANTAQLGGEVYRSDRVPGVVNFGTTYDIAGPIQVVSQLSVPDGVGGHLTEYYFYRGMKGDRLLGNLGFRETITQKPAKDGSWLTTVTDYSQSAPYVGLPISVKTYLAKFSDISDQNLLASEASVYCDQVAGSAAASSAVSSGNSCAPVGPLKKPYQLKKVTANYDADPAHTKLPGTTSTSYVNDNGDPTMATVSATLTGGAGDTYTTTTTNSNFTADKTDCSAIDTCNWLLGRPQTLSIEKASPSTMLSTSAGTAAGATATAGTAAGGAQVLTKSLAFGAVQVGSSSTLTAYVTSDGTAAITFPSPASTGSGVFSVVSTTCSGSLAPNAACSIVVKFAPTAIGSASGVLTVPTSGGNLTASLGGTGQAPSLVLDHVNPAASGWTMPAYSASTLGVYVRNTGVGPVTINGVSMSQGTAYTENTSTSCGTAHVVVAGATCWILPGWGGGPGAVSGTLTVVSTAGTITTNLSAIQKTLDLSVAGNGPSTKSTANLTVTVTNNTIGNFTFGSPALRLASASGQGAFALVTNNCPTVLAANGGSCTMVVQYTAGAQAGAGAVSASAYGSFEYQDMLDGRTLTGQGRYRNGPADVASLALNATTLRGNLNLSATTLSYANQTVGVASATQSVLVVNNSTSAIATLSGISVSAGASDFTQTNNCPATLSYADSCNIVVTFRPSATGTRTGTVSIASDASGLSSISLTGTGVAAPAVNSVTLTPIVASGDAATLGWSTSNATSVTVACAAPASYSYAGTTTSTSGVVVLTSGTGAGVCTVTAGNGVGGFASASASVNVVTRPSITPSVAFGNVQPGATSTLGATLTNNATVTLGLTPPSASSVQGTYYSFAGTTCGSSLAAGASCNVSVSFTPTALAMGANGTLTVLTAVGNVSAALTGNGAQAQLSVSPATIAYGSIPVAQNSNANVTVTNTGNIATTGLSFAPGASTSVSGCTSQIAAGSNCVLTVTVNPSSASNTSGSLAASVGNGPGATVNWTASPLAPAWTLRNTGMPGSLFVGQSATATISVSNNGDVGLSGLSLSFSRIYGGNTFALTNGTTCGTGLPGWTGCVYVVQLTASTGALGAASENWALTTTTPGVNPAAFSGTFLTTIYAVPTLGSATFAPQQVNTSATQAVTFTNNSPIPLPMTVPSAASISGTGFSFVGTTCGSSLVANASCSVTVQFAPSSQASYSGTLTFNAAGNNFGAPLSGTGVPAMVAFTSNGGTTTTVFTNPNGFAVTPSDSGLVWVKGADFAGVTSNTCNAPVPAHGTCTISYTAPLPDCAMDNYTVRSYVSDSAGTAYGAQVSRSNSNGVCR